LQTPVSKIDRNCRAIGGKDPKKGLRWRSVMVYYNTIVDGMLGHLGQEKPKRAA
jgi:hypothetical protein